MVEDSGCRPRRPRPPPGVAARAMRVCSSISRGHPARDRVASSRDTGRVNLAGPVELSDYLYLSSVVDRLAILEVKGRALQSPEYRKVCQTEISRLSAALHALDVPEWSSSATYIALIGIHSSLWNLENRARTHEGTQSFGSEFGKCIQSIRRLNRRRHVIRQEIINSVPCVDSTDLVEVPSGVEGVLDRLAIRIVRLGAEPSGLAHRFAPWFVQLNRLGIHDLKAIPGFERLLCIHRAMTRAWSDIDRSYETRAQFDGRLERAGRSLYLLNDARSEARERIRDAFPAPFWDTKEYTTYTTPEGWSKNQLSWIGDPGTP